MSEITTTDKAVLDAAPAPTFKMSIGETVAMLNNYLIQADKSLEQLQKHVDNASNQINEWKRIQLMIVGQKQLINDILNKAVEAPPAEAPVLETK